MDDLEFRRTLLADPKCNDPQVVDAIAADPQKKALWNDLQQLNQKMIRASQVEVPDGLAHRLLLKQSMSEHTKRRNTKRYIRYALVASIAFTFGMTYLSWQQQHQVMSLSEHAIAHVLHEGDYALGANEDISLQQVNQKLARFGGELTAQVGQIYYANFCDFNNIKSLHLVMQGESGKVSVFIVPHEQAYKTDNLKEGIWNSQSVDFSRTSLVVVSAQKSDAIDMKQKISAHLLFTA